MKTQTSEVYYKDNGWIPQMIYLLVNKECPSRQRRNKSVIIHCYFKFELLNGRHSLMHKTSLM